MAKPLALPGALRATLAAHADPARAAPTQAYMKSAMPFLGIEAPLRRRLVGAVAAAHPVADAAMLLDSVLLLWRAATHREERYAALDLLRVAKHRKLVDLSFLPAVQEMIVTGPWWDHNDEISGQSLCLLLQRHPAQVKPALREWARSDSLWLRRAAMLCQRRIKQGFDAVLLYDCILPSTGHGAMAQEFFIRKGMGWALRERSYAAPEEVLAFCAEYHDRLSALTRREALKVIQRRRLA